MSVVDGKLLVFQKPKLSLQGETRSFPVDDESLDFERSAQEEHGSHLNDVFRRAIRRALEALLDEEMRALVGAAKWQRTASRTDDYNGSYPRGLTTSLGKIKVAIPRSRESGSPCDLLGRYSRRSGEIDDSIVEAYVHGVSTRGMGEVTKALLDERVSRSTVSRITKVLETKVEELRRAPIEKPVRYLYLDATFLDARWARSVENVSALIAYGVDTDGYRRLLAVTIGASESEESWTELLQQLLERGLRGVKLVIADAHAGLAKAARRLLPEAALQRCVVHLERNVLAKTPARLRERLGRELSEVFKATSAKDARERLDALKAGLGKQVPEAIEILVHGFSAATQYFLFPEEHWIRLRTTNGVERLNREVKRRVDAIGAFPDRASALRLVTAVALKATEIWRTRRYLDMSEDVIRGTPLDESGARSTNGTHAASKIP